MKKIAIIVRDINEELEGAEHYAKMATQYKDDDKPLADAYADMAAQELGHVDRLCGSSRSIVTPGISRPRP